MIFNTKWIHRVGLYSGARTNLKVGAPIWCKALEIFFSVEPLHFFGSKSTISRIGERFRDGQYSLVCFLFAVLHSRCRRAQPFVKVEDTCPRALWRQRHCESVKPAVGMENPVGHWIRGDFHWFSFITIYMSATPNPCVWGLKCNPHGSQAGCITSPPNSCYPSCFLNLAKVREYVYSGNFDCASSTKLLTCTLFVLYFIFHVHGEFGLINVHLFDI